MKSIPVNESIGMVLGHDVTEIIPERYKGPAFKKGHVIKKSDIEHLLRIGKSNVYIMDLKPGQIHENEAALRIVKQVSGQNIEYSSPSEGRINLRATISGLLKINVKALETINEGNEVALATLHTNQFVEKGENIGGCRIIPLYMEASKLASIENMCVQTSQIDTDSSVASPVLEVKPLQSFSTGLIITGSEVYHGRIQDAFSPVIKKKIQQYGSHIQESILVSDDIATTVKAIHQQVSQGCNLILITGGMSVDPDDMTPSAIRASGADVVSYGAPVFPGAMFMIAYLDDIPVLGLPGCVMYYKASVLDLILPRILAKEVITSKDISRLGHGGFCNFCDQCHFPNCGFGKCGT